MTLSALMWDKTPESTTEFADWFRSIADKIESGAIRPSTLTVQPEFESDRHFGSWSPGGKLIFEWGGDIRDSR